MKSILLRFALLLAAPLGFVSCAASAGRSMEPSLAGDRGKDRQELARLEADINRYRSSFGKAPVPRHAGLDKMAREHCEFMAMNPGKFKLGSTIITHYGFEERSLRAQRQYGMLSLVSTPLPCC